MNRLRDLIRFPSTLLLWDDPGTEWALKLHAPGQEQRRLQRGSGLLEFARPVEILQRHLRPRRR